MGGRRIETTFCNEIRPGITGRQLRGIHKGEIALSAPGVLNSLHALVSAHTGHGDPFQRLSFELLANGDMIERIDYHGAALQQRYGRQRRTGKPFSLPFEHAFTIAHHLLYLEHSFAVRTITERETFLSKSMTISFAPAF
ncbi:hypothetical protein [Janthinobacterium agaricidamnosum]|nr:hypothetical protein [Janthinobacterium agaricidamnosum]